MTMVNPLKRLKLEEEGSTSKRRKLVRQRIPDGAASILPDEAVSAMMEHSVGLIFKSCGFGGSTAMAMESTRVRAGQYMESLVKQMMLHAQSQRRIKPTILDCEETLRERRITTTSLEEEMERYKRKRPYIFTTDVLPSSMPIPDADASLLGPELIEPRTTTTTRTPVAVWQQLADSHRATASPRPVSTTVVKTERRYIDAHHPQLPSKHTYASTGQVMFERGKDQKQIREQATEEARLAGESLRNLLANFSKVNAEPKEQEEVKTKAVNTKRAARDAMWKRVWEEVSLEGAMNDKEKKAWLDVIVNADKDLWSKGSMKRVLKREICLV